MATNWATLHMYKRLLKAAKDYPSTRRVSIINEIRVAFREDASKTGSDAEECIAQAKVAEEQLNRFPKDTRNNSDIEYNQR
jgi:hypothetical protein